VRGGAILSAWLPARGHTADARAPGAALRGPGARVASLGRQWALPCRRPARVVGDGGRRRRRAAAAARCCARAAHDLSAARCRSALNLTRPPGCCCAPPCPPCRCPQAGAAAQRQRGRAGRDLLVGRGGAADDAGHPGLRERAGGGGCGGALLGRGTGARTRCGEGGGALRKRAQGCCGGPRLPRRQLRLQGHPPTVARRSLSNPRAAACARWGCARRRPTACRQRRSWPTLATTRRRGGLLRGGGRGGPGRHKPEQGQTLDTWHP
jgi:hypothetical protein